MPGGSPHPGRRLLPTRVRGSAGAPRRGPFGRAFLSPGRDSLARPRTPNPGGKGSGGRRFGRERAGQFPRLRGPVPPVEPLPGRGLSCVRRPCRRPGFPRRPGPHAGGSGQCAEAARTAPLGRQLRLCPPRRLRSREEGRVKRPYRTASCASSPSPRPPRPGSHPKAINPARRREPQAGDPPRPARPPGAPGPPLPPSPKRRAGRKPGTRVSRGARAAPSPRSSAAAWGAITRPKRVPSGCASISRPERGPARGPLSLGASPPGRRGPRSAGTGWASRGRRCQRSRLQRRGRGTRGDRTRSVGGWTFGGQRPALPGASAPRRWARPCAPSPARPRGPDALGAREAGASWAAGSAAAAGPGESGLQPLPPPGPPLMEAQTFGRGRGCGPARRGGPPLPGDARGAPRRPPGGSDVAARGQWAAGPALERARGPIRRRPPPPALFRGSAGLSPQSPALSPASAEGVQGDPPPAPPQRRPRPPLRPGSPLRGPARPSSRVG